MPAIAAPLTDLSPYIYGTTRLGDEKLPFEDRVAIATKAVDAGVWLHTSRQYGKALEVLRATFDARPDAPTPPMIFKLGWESVDQVREQIAICLEPLGQKSMAIGQLFLTGALVEDFRSGGPGIDGLLRLKEEGLIGRFVLETWPWSSQTTLEALQGGHAERVIDALIFYFNPLQRFISNELWDEVRKRDFPIIAMRTVAGGDVRRMRDFQGEGYPPEYLRKRAIEVALIFERSGCGSWPEFCVRYVFGVPQVRATVGATSKRENLDQFFQATASPEPLPAEIQDEMMAIQRRWADEHDRHAEQWSM